MVDTFNSFSIDDVLLYLSAVREDGSWSVLKPELQDMSKPG